MQSSVKRFCILKRNSLSGKKEAERLRGRMVFFEGYTFGRVANGAVRSLSRWRNYNARVLDLDLEMSQSDFPSQPCS